MLRFACDLGKALAAFRQDLGARIDDVVLVAATEFGRTARQNAGYDGPVLDGLLRV